MIDMSLVILMNVFIASVGVISAMFPLYWLRTHNSDYKDGFRLILPSLSQAAVGCLIFGFVYLMRYIGVFDDADLQKIFRPVMSIFLLLPFTMVVSLHYWKK